MAVGSREIFSLLKSAGGHAQRLIQVLLEHLIVGGQGLGNRLALGKALLVLQEAVAVLLSGGGDSLGGGVVEQLHIGQALAAAAADDGHRACRRR